MIEDKPNKKFKGSESGKGSHPTPPGPGRPKSKIAQVSIAQRQFFIFFFAHTFCI